MNLKKKNGCKWILLNPKRLSRKDEKKAFYILPGM